MEHVELEAQAREVVGKKVKNLRAKNLIPAVVYGPDTPASPIQVEERSLATALQQAGSSTLIDLTVDEESEAQVVLAREVQRDALTGQLRHVDFYQVRLTETVRTSPRLEFVGESPLVKAGTAVMIYGMNEVEVECLPTDLFSSLEVDVSVLETLDDNILAGELTLPPNVTLIADPTDVVVSVVTTRAAVVEEAEEAAAVELEEEAAEALAEEDAEPED
jgi:large subunit ribosomal protein L25